MRVIRNVSREEGTITILEDGRDISRCCISTEIGMGVPYAEEITDFRLEFPVNV
jgi:hypothetical protein